MIYAIDFDGTLCKSLYPKIGYENKDIVNYVKGLKENGHTLILWTCRTGDELEAAIDWCNDKGIEFDYVNENTQDSIDQYGADCRKINADYYLDDKSLTLDSVTSELEEAKNQLNKLKSFDSTKQKR